MTDQVRLTSIDGSITPAGEAMISAHDDGLLRGDGVFEFIRVYEGRPFALGDHVDRLERSGASIALRFDRRALQAEIATLIAEAGPIDCGLRLVVTRGGRRIAIVEPLAQFAPAAAVATVDYAHASLLIGVKSISYAANMMASRIAAAADADDAVLIRPDGIVLEGPTSAIFWAGSDGRLKTPALDCGILDSITRDRVVNELDVEQGAYPTADLLDASEAFLASTTREIQPIASIDGARLPVVPGEGTERAMAAFQRVLARELGD